ncbi:MAG: type III-B CRISPR-associated protein Cas10/Cmr2 [Epsilonproteobacteria bacterium]|nr:type III-B CRISPR-associated protein Cas10/Cmr2 [Campylobacterota bacterium]
MTYLALTIGPIYKTLSSAKKTRELWGGSYLFSYIMKQIISEFKEREFIVPYIKDKSIFDSGKEVGLFHDRFIFESKEGDQDALKSIVKEVLSSLASNMKLDLKFLEDYLQINIVEKELKEGENPILEMTPYLDTAELFYSLGQYSGHPLAKVLQGGNLFLTKDAFGEKKSFPSLPEIALHDMMTAEVKSLINADDELSVYEKVESKNYHKYYAIVHADGDSMGKVVESLKGRDAFQAFSKKLFEYCNISHKHIKAFGGETIFAGGDDLLFFAPVVSGDKTIFELCDDISKDFDKSFNGEATLSFGVSMQYHKFPLYEALENSRNLLFADAKEGNKNNIAFCVTKHSGQTFKAVIHKGDKELYENFKLFSSNISGGEGMDNFLHSIHHKIDANKVMLSQILKDKNHLKNFFDNYFNKEVHDANYRAFFEQLIAFMHEAHLADEKKALDVVYATLRFIKFVQGDKA